MKKKKIHGPQKTEDKNNNCNHSFQLYFNSILWSTEKKLTGGRKEKYILRERRRTENQIVKVTTTTEKGREIKSEERKTGKVETKNTLR